MSTPRKSTGSVATLHASAGDQEALSDALNWKEKAPALHFAPLENFAQRLNKVRAARNPLLEAARVLIRAQANIPEHHLDAKQALTLRMRLEQEIRIFQQLCEQANLRRDHMIGARYCLCTALDEAAMQSEWGENIHVSAAWAAKSLATTFLEDNKGGERIYLLIGRLLENASEHIDLLQVIYRILSLGFEGRYRHDTAGDRKHLAVRTRLYNEIIAHRGLVPLRLSPAQQPQTEGQRRLWFYDVPLWLTAAVLSAILLGMFGWYKYQLLSRTAVIREQIGSIAHLVPSPAFTPPTLHLKALLKDEIAAGTVSVAEDATHSTVTFRGDALFAPGGASVKAAMGPLIEKIGRQIARVPGKVTVLGYTDALPIRSRRFASNQVLSEARAEQVVQWLRMAGVSADRLAAVGKGAADPVGDNRTAQGRALNRRVAIDVAQ